MSRASVLIVEDHFLVAETYRHTIQELGYRVVGPAGTIESALDILTRERVDVGLLDVMLRGRPVTPVAARLDEMGTPYFFLTGMRNADALPPCYDRVPLLEKPTSRDRLQDALTEALRRAPIRSATPMSSREHAEAVTPPTAVSRK